MNAYQIKRLAWQACWDNVITAERDPEDIYCENCKKVTEKNPLVELGSSKRNERRGIIMNTIMKCPRCRNAVYLIGTRYYCFCGWSKKREKLTEKQPQNINSIRRLF